VLKFQAVAEKTVKKL